MKFDIFGSLQLLFQHLKITPMPLFHSKTLDWHQTLEPLRHLGLVTNFIVLITYPYTRNLFLPAYFLVASDIHESKQISASEQMHD
jgi:hypothetical protein